jgi:arylsulfatase A-like enzyme
MLMSYPPEIKGGAVDRETLICNGLDIIPTVCDFADAEVPADFKGKSLRPAASSGVKHLRDAVCIESETGRMCRSLQYKYIVSEYGDNREQFFDMKNDPDEIENLIRREDLQDVIQKHREYLASWVNEIDDRIGKEYIIR